MRTLPALLVLASCSHPPAADTAQTGDASRAPCNSTTGRTIPLSICTTADPCAHPIRLAGRAPITLPVNVPVCATSRSSHPAYEDGPPAQFTPPDGVTRYACVFHPAGASASAPRPLVIFIPGSGGSAQNVYDFTLLRDKAARYDLVGDRSRPGFHLVSVSARNLHWPGRTPEDGPKHDTQYRDLASPSSNPDVANVDRVVDELAADPAVDPARIYITGWSNGAEFAQLYAIARHDRATPGGHRIAAVAVYSGGDPFNNTPDQPQPSCQLDPYPRSTVPVLIVSRACDIFSCSNAQAEALAAAGSPGPPGCVVTEWLDALSVKVGDPNAKWLMLNGTGVATTTCNTTTRCTIRGALTNHLRWPDGLAAGDGGNDHEQEMLEFLRAHPR